MKLKLVKADVPLQGITLDLNETSEMTYLCSITGYTFIDCWDELFAISKSKETEFFDMHLFTQDISNKLTWIQEVRLVD